MGEDGRQAGGYTKVKRGDRRVFLFLLAKVGARLRVVLRTRGYGSAGRAVCSGLDRSDF